MVLKIIAFCKNFFFFCRRREDTKFYNTCGKALSFTRWNVGEPNNYKGTPENCVQMYSHGAGKGKWNDQPCSSLHGYICQFKAHRCECLSV